MRTCIIIFCLLFQILVIAFESDCTFFLLDEMLTEQSLPLFLSQAYREQKIHFNDFSSEKHLVVKKLPIVKTFNTLQIFLVISTYPDRNPSTYIVKEAKNASSEIKHLQAIKTYPGMYELIAPSISPHGLPSIIIPFAYLSYRNKKDSLHYVMIMPAAAGISLDTLITQFRDNQSEQNAIRVFCAYKRLGYELGNFHQKFMEPNQHSKIGKTIVHGDFHCSNIFYDETANHCTFIDNETMAHSLETRTEAGIDILRLFFDFFSISETNPRKNFIKGIDLTVWHNIALKSFIKGYASSYPLNDRTQVVNELKAIFNNDYNLSWFRFKPNYLEQLRETYINPIFNEIEKKLI